MRRLFLALFLCAAAPAMADPACLAAPTQDCVFQMAVDQALAAPDAMDIVGGLARTAILQEAEGREDWSATLDLLMPVLDKSGADPEAIRNALVVAAMGIELGKALGDRTLALSPRSTARISEMGKQTGRIRSAYDEADFALYQLGLDGNRTGIEVQLATPQSGLGSTRALVAAKGLIAGGHVDAALDLLPQIVLRSDADEVKGLALGSVMHMSGLDAAHSFARRFADRRDRAKALVDVAIYMAWEGRVPDARSIALDPVIKAFLPDDADSLMKLAEVHARSGDTQRAEAVLARLDPAATWLDPVNVRAMSAMVAGDFDRVLTIIAQTDDPHRAKRPLFWALDAYLKSDGTKLDQFLARLPAPLLPEALSTVGKYQIGSGDLPAAMATLARLQSLGGTLSPSADLRRGLAPLLARKGRISEAVAMADAFAEAEATSEVAAEIE